MPNLFKTCLYAKGREADLAALKNDLLRHCTVIRKGDDAVLGNSAADYAVDLGRWNPQRKDWVSQPVEWWLQLAEGQSDLLPVRDGELKATAVGMGAAPLHFIDGLRELYSDIQLSAYAIDLTNGFGEDWRCAPEGTSCIEEVKSCWEGEEVWYWKKGGRLMIDDGKPVAEELLAFAGTRFVMVDGVPVSVVSDAAKEYVRRRNP
jgi:hypothetical protein